MFQAFFEGHNPVDGEGKIAPSLYYHFWGGNIQNRVLKHSFIFYFKKGLFLDFSDFLSQQTAFVLKSGNIVFRKKNVLFKRNKTYTFSVFCVFINTPFL